jgi:hypothetical protein
MENISSSDLFRGFKGARTVDNFGYVLQDTGKFIVFSVVAAFEARDLCMT